MSLRFRVEGLGAGVQSFARVQSIGFFVTITAGDLLFGGADAVFETARVTGTLNPKP